MKKSNIELLRIFASIMVLIIHITSSILTGGVIEKYTMTWYYAVIMRSIAAPAIVIFLLISGYVFGISKKRKSIKDTMKRLLGPLCFYLPILAISDFIITHSISQTIYHFFHFLGLFHHLWYIYVYLLIVFIVYSVEPFLKKERNSILKVVLVLLLLVSFAFSYQLLFHDSFLIFYYIKNEFIYSFLIYVFGVIVGRYDIKINRIILIVCYLLSVIILVSIYLFLVKNDEDDSLLFMISYTNLLNLVSAISIFLFFKDLNINNSWMNQIGRLTYGNYINHVLFISLIKEVYPYFLFSDYRYYFLYDFSVVLLVFFVSILVEFIRQYLAEKFLNSKK